MKLVFILLLLGFIKTVLAYRVFHAVPLVELKRRARSKEDRRAKSIYKVAAFGESLDILLWALGTASLAAAVVIAAGLAWWLAVLSLVFAAWLVTFAPKPKAGGWLWGLVAWGSRYMFRVLGFLHPLLNLLVRLRPERLQLHIHTGMYEREDLLELLRAQNHQVDNRISEQELKIAAGALTFGDKKVANVMTPRRLMRFVSEDEVLGPTLMDELYNTGFSRFPVVKGPTKSASPSIIGTLYLKDVVEIGQEDKGKVANHMKKDVSFINEDCTLRQALDAFLKSKHHMLIVVNNFEEIAGLLTLEDVLEQIVGEPIVDEFDKYDDLRAVAGLQANAQKAAQREVKPSEQGESVVN